MKEQLTLKNCLPWYQIHTIHPQIQFNLISTTKALLQTLKNTEFDILLVYICAIYLHTIRIDAPHINALYYYRMYNMYISE